MAILIEVYSLIINIILWKLFPLYLFLFEVVSERSLSLFLICIIRTAEIEKFGVLELLSDNSEVLRESEVKGEVIAKARLPVTIVLLYNL